MKAEKTYQNKVARTIQQRRSGESALEFADNRPGGILRIFNNIPTMQRQTKVVNHQTDYFRDDIYNGSTELVGTRVDILLDPNDIQYGSEPGSDLDDTMMAINNHWKTSWIKGHLINHHLGGPGIASNLYPISRSANSNHCNYVENAVINNLGNLPAGSGILYSVEVTEAEHLVSNPKCKLTCEAYITDDDNSSNNYTPIFKGIDVISEPNNKPKPVFSGGYDIWGNPWNVAQNSHLTSQKRIFPGWGFVSNGVNSWNTFNW